MTSRQEQGVRNKYLVEQNVYQSSIPSLNVLCKLGQINGHLNHLILIVLYSETVIEFVTCNMKYITPLSECFFLLRVFVSEVPRFELVLQKPAFITADTKTMNLKICAR